MHPPTKFSLLDAEGQEKQFPPDGPVLLALVKEDCDTCNLTLPLLEAVHRDTDEDLDVWVAVQKRDDIDVLRQRHDLTMLLLDDDALDLNRFRPQPPLECGAEPRQAAFQRHATR